MNIFLLIVFLFAITFAYAGLRGAPWAPTKKEDVDRFLTLAQIKKGDKVVDLGCGDGRLLYAVAQQGAITTGYEISLLPFVLAKLRGIGFKKGQKPKINFKDFWRVNLSEADVVYFFLMPKVYKKLKQKLDKELKTGAKVIAYVWAIDSWEPEKVCEKKGFPNLFLYIKK